MSKPAHGLERRARHARLRDAERRALWRGVDSFTVSLSIHLVMVAVGVGLGIALGVGFRGGLVLFAVGFVPYVAWRQTRAHRMDRRGRIERRRRWGRTVRWPDDRPPDGSVDPSGPRPRVRSRDEHTSSSMPAHMVVVFFLLAVIVPVYVLLAYFDLLPVWFVP